VTETPVVYREAEFAVEVTRDVVYGQGLSHSSAGSSSAVAMELTLDVYEPAGAPGPRPAIVLIHGGGFRSGTSQNGAFVTAGHYFAERGWVAFSINYRLSGDNGTAPAGWAGSDAAYAAVRDAKAAIRWVRANAVQYEIDPDRITAQGGSAGAIAALAIGTSRESDFRDELTVDEDWTLATTNLGKSSRVATVVEHWGSLSAANAPRWNDGVDRIDASDAPTIIFHGTEDPVVSFNSGLQVRDTFEAAGIPVEFHPIPGAGHSPWNVLVDGREQNAIALDFIAEQQGLEVR
jgi:para-nitrobenzyl esterase